MLQWTVIAASSLSKRWLMFELLSHITKTIIARPGMSSVNEDQKKNVFQVIKQLERRQHQFVIWHDDISNSISQHP